MSFSDDHHQFEETTNDTYDTLPSIKLAPQSETPMRYNVMVCKTIGSHWDWKIGHIVTHLSPDDWCKLHGYVLHTIYPGSRIATASEIAKPVDLF